MAKVRRRAISVGRSGRFETVSNMGAHIGGAGRLVYKPRRSADQSQGLVCSLWRMRSGHWQRHRVVLWQDCRDNRVFAALNIDEDVFHACAESGFRHEIELAIANCCVDVDPLTRDRHENHFDDDEQQQQASKAVACYSSNFQDCPF